MTATKLDPANLKPAIDPETVPFDRTDEAPAAEPRLQQDRAERAIAFWVGVKGPGYNLFASGERGLEKYTTVRHVIDAHAAPAPPQDDWVYVFNFENQYRPRALRLSFGTALGFRDAMGVLVEDLAGAVPAAFEAEEYKSRRNAIQAETAAAQEEKLGALRDEAAEQDIALVRTPVGFGFAPTHNGEIVKPEVYNRWAEADRKATEAKVEKLQEELNQLLQHDLPELERKMRAEIRDLDRETAEATIRLAVAAVAGQFKDIEPIQDHLEKVTEDLITHFHLFIALAKAGEEVPMAAKLEHPLLRRYAVNVMDAAYSDETDASGVPVIEEPEPSYARLIGRIEHQPHEGALITDFTLIKPGALHRANGGYLLLNARDLLMQPFAWEALKRCLKTGKLRISSVADRLSLISTTSLEPDEIPLKVKVALIGDAFVYYLLSSLDPDFQSLFKVHADFDTDMDHSGENLTALARSLAGLVRKLELRPFDRAAIVAVMGEMSREADDAAKLSLKIEAMEDLLREADHWAKDAKAAQVGAEHVERVIDERRHRSDRLHRRSLEMIEREIVNVATDGAAVGQINGLSVITLGPIRFGRPARITAQARLGTGKIIDIEREVKLGGPIHSKGVLILSSFLATRFGMDHPVAFSASLVFEQSYGGVDGDSASSTELYALLSTLSGAPIRQALAVTGSVDQFGRVQAIGGVNEKIEGFFELCQSRGFAEGQGVLIPSSNVQHLNLRKDIIAAVEDGRFAIHAVDHVDDGIELLTGIPAGQRAPDGTYPDDTINGRVAEKLKGFAETMKKLRAVAGAEDDETEEAGDEIMIRLRAVIVSVSSAAPHREVSESGFEMARLFRVPVRGVVAPQPETAALAGFPGSFLPSAARRSVHGERTLISATAGGDLRIRTELEQIARRYQVEMHLSIQHEPASAEDEREDAIAVLPLDMSHARLGPQVRAAVDRIPPSGGVLLVPERHPSRAGGVICLTDGSEPDVTGTAGQIAQRMGIPMHVVRIVSGDEDMAGPDATGAAGTIGPGEVLDIPALGLNAARLLVCSPRHLDSLGLDDPRSPIRRCRSSLLVLGGDRGA